MFEFSARSLRLQGRMTLFLAEDIIPAEHRYEEQIRLALPSRPNPAALEQLKEKARSLGLWNLFLPHREKGHEPLSNLDYAPIAELSGRSVFLAPESINCSAPDTGNMELLSMFGTSEQKKQWLEPLMAGKIRSAYAMTEPAVASSDAGNIETTIVRDGDEWVINGRKWWTSGTLRDATQLFIVMGVTYPEAGRHHRHSMVIVPRHHPGVTVIRDLTFMGYESFESHVEVVFDDVRVPVVNMLGDAGEGFAMSQARLGPGRIHHCMRLVGMAERALELMIDRGHSRETFGRRLVDYDTVQSWIAESRIEIDQARLYTMYTARLMDTVGNRVAASQISGIKVAVPRMAANVLDRAIQVFGGAGLGPDVPLARFWTEARVLRIADGPDEVHLRAVSRAEMKQRKAH